jgi:hypothetical protein
MTQEENVMESIMLTKIQEGYNLAGDEASQPLFWENAFRLLSYLRDVHAWEELEPVLEKRGFSAIVINGRSPGNPWLAIVEKSRDSMKNMRKEFGLDTVDAG